jgi:hypothetical protein
MNELERGKSKERIVSRECQGVSKEWECQSQLRLPWNINNTSEFLWGKRKVM